MNTTLIVLHALAAAVWVGGMFFAYLVLRPSMTLLETPPDRLRLWAGVFRKFFIWVWHAVVILPITGFALTATYWGGMATAPMHIHWMAGLGILMIVLYLVLFVGPYRRFTNAVRAEDWPTAAEHLNRIRQFVGSNLVLGLITIAIGASGRYW